jgi:methyl-accepting chemotaxis protein
MSSASTAHGGRFEQSFMFHMIRDFFLLLLLVAVVELAIRYAALRWDFARAEPQRVNQAARQLANDVKSIMLNSGGPVAAQTIYPILDRNYRDLGLAIAVLPSAVTVESMKITRNMDALGLMPEWEDGTHQQASVSLTAEQFCLGCHVKAQVGDVLGTVAVRSYLAHKEDIWWQEVRLTTGALSLKILAHTIVLFFLLKVRMEPLLTLRGTVAALAKGVMDLRPRAGVKTADEFGELAQDLNHFLDRITLVVGDLDKILSEVVEVGDRLSGLNRHLERQLEGLRDGSLRLLGAGAQHGLDQRLLAAQESGAFAAHLQTLSQSLDQTLAQLAAGGALSPGAAQALREPLQRAQHSFERVQAALQAALPPLTVTEDQAAEYRAFAQSLREMALLEASMSKVAESGQRVLARLTHAQNEAGRSLGLAGGAAPAPADGTPAGAQASSPT